MHPIGEPADGDGCHQHFADYFRHVDYGVSAGAATALFAYFERFVAIVQEPTLVEIGAGPSKNEHLVQYGCTYAVGIQSSPIAHPSRAVRVNFTVPGTRNACQCPSMSVQCPLLSNVVDSFSSMAGRVLINLLT